MADAGYDVADYRDIEPAFGTLAEAEALIAEAHELGLRVLLDIVPNHTSDQHPWFQAALAAARARRSGTRYIFRPGAARRRRSRRTTGSVFGGSAWTRVTEADGTLGRVVPAPVRARAARLELGQPRGREEFEDMLRFWFDRGVDGFRIDVANGLVKDAGLPDAATLEPTASRRTGPAHPTWDRDGVHDVYRGWRAVADAYAEPRVFVAEAWVPEPRAAGPLPAAGRAAHRLQLRLPRGAAGTPPRLRDGRSTRRWRARAGRRPADLGAVQPRRRPPRHPLRPRRHRRASRPRAASRPSRPTSSSAPAGPGRPRC